MPATPRRVLGYARVSSAEQALGTSLADQQASVTAYAEARGLTVARIFVEAESGGSEKFERREQVQALMREARAGDLVLVDKLDRWSRDPEFTYRSVRELRERGARIFFVAERCDPDTHEGDTQLNVNVLVARQEHKRIRERTIGARNRLRDQGYYVEGRPPFGYRRPLPAGSRDLRKNILVVVPEEAAKVKEMFRLAILGKSLNQISAALTVQKDRVHHSLHSRHYLGLVRNAQGEWIKAGHEALVSASTFERANLALSHRKLGGPRVKGAPAETDTWVLRDLAICARCGAKMGAAYAGPKGPMRRHYYRCLRKCQARGPRATTGSFVPVASADLEASTMVLVKLSRLRDDLVSQPEPMKNKGKGADIATRRAKLEKRRDRYIEAHADGAIELPELRARLAGLDAERARLSAEEAAQTAAERASSPEVRSAMLREVKTLLKAWHGATPAEKRHIAALLATSFGLSTIADPIPNWRTMAELSEDLGA